MTLKIFLYYDGLVGEQFFLALYFCDQLAAVVNNRCFSDADRVPMKTWLDKGGVMLPNYRSEICIVGYESLDWHLDATGQRQRILQAFVVIGKQT